LADSEKDPAVMENHRNRPEVIQALKGSVGELLRYSTTVKEDMLYVAMPVKKSEKTLGVLRISLFLKDINNLLDNLKTNILHIVLLVIVVSLLGAFIFAKGLTKPIRKLSAAFRRVASGDFDVKVLLKNQDEVKELADSFNLMSDQIKSLFAEVSRQKESLNSIISSVQEGLLVLDRREKIILCNESLKKLVQNNFIEEKFYWEVIREAKFGDLVKKVREEKKNAIDEVALNNRIYLCGATIMESREEIVIVFHDITEMKNVENIKRDFVVNVSHELRTPLTSIKGFAETLEEEAGEKERQYVEIIKRNTDRLINIVQDLLSLSELEEKGITLTIEEVRVKKVIENVIRIFKHGLKEKSLDLKLDIKDDLPPIKADPFKLEQMFINLIDNAIKYTEKGEITVTLKQKEEHIVIVIQDTGIGIPKEHLPRIFERFYVMDKSRSRRLGGTGLGLSIVKHIVLLHNGTIDVESTFGAGTKFIITLPIILP
jgi:two-component system phosphate regulon sensor histidine kinase PhoR